MLLIGEYNRERAREYARRWAFDRNPLFADYTGIGGNCTNFVSQCVYAGSCRMNFTPVFGWYYIDADDRTASFTGVRFFYNFLVGNEGVGPFATEIDEAALEVGDVVQLGREADGYYHTLLVVGREEEGGLLVAAQSDDAYNRPLSSYSFEFARYLHIEGVRYSLSSIGDCYEPLLLGEELLIEGAGSYTPEEAPPESAPMITE